MGRRRRRGLPINGWVIVDKPRDVTSTDVVAIVRRAFNAQKAGHGGTLDPLAEGILPIALGEATKTVPFAMDATKSYDFTIRWGEERTTDDLEGDVTVTSDKRPTTDEIMQGLEQFTGQISQVPPQFSAIKVDGARAYDLARGGEDVALKARPVHVIDLDYCGPLDDTHGAFRMTCGKGTYVRALARDLGRALGSAATVAAIRRTRVGPFDADRAISLDSLRDLDNSPPPEQALLPVETALDGIPALALTGSDAQLVRNGGAVRITRLMADQLAQSGLSGATPPSDEDGAAPLVKLFDPQGRFLALASPVKGTVQPVRVFHC